MSNVLISSLDLDSVTGGNGAVLEGPAAEQLYGKLMDLRNTGHPRVSGTGVSTAGGPHVSFSAPIVCASTGQGRTLKVWCSVGE
jgi:hypothetical protein